MKKVLKYLAFLFLAAILLHFSFKGVEWGDFTSGLKSCNWWWIAASMAIGILGFLFRALRWRILLRTINKEITLRETFDGINIGYITNFVFPRAGEVARCGVIANTAKYHYKCLGLVGYCGKYHTCCLGNAIYFCKGKTHNEVVCPQTSLYRNNPSESPYYHKEQGVNCPKMAHLREGIYGCKAGKPVGGPDCKCIDDEHPFVFHSESGKNTLQQPFCYLHYLPYKPVLLKPLPYYPQYCCRKDQCKAQDCSRPDHSVEFPLQGLQDLIVHKCPELPPREEQEQEHPQQETNHIQAPLQHNCPELETEYIELVDAQMLKPVSSWDDAAEIQLWCAVYARPVRLIDNIKIK